MSTIYFSIVIPLYNKEKSITRAIESVISQTSENFELIIINDGSTDDSLIQASSYNDPRIKIISQANQGVSSARNLGIKNAKHLWIAFLDADDMWLPEHLTELEKIIKKIPDAGMVATQSFETKKTFPENNKKNNTIKEIDYFLLASKKIGIINSSCVCIRKDILDKIGGFSVEYKLGEDLELWAKVALEYKTAISKKITSIYFRDHGGVMLTSMSKQKTKEISKKINISDISPSCSFLIKMMDNQLIRKEKLPSVILYINSRLAAIIRSSLIKKNIKQAKETSKLFLKPRNTKILLYLYLTLLPKNLLIILFSSRELTKKFYYFLLTENKNKI